MLDVYTDLIERCKETKSLSHASNRESNESKSDRETNRSKEKRKRRMLNRLSKKEQPREETYTTAVHKAYKLHFSFLGTIFLLFFINPIITRYGRDVSRNIARQASGDVRMNKQEKKENEKIDVCS